VEEKQLRAQRNAEIKKAVEKQFGIQTKIARETVEIKNG